MASAHSSVLFRLSSRESASVGTREKKSCLASLGSALRLLIMLLMACEKARPFFLLNRRSSGHAFLRMGQDTTYI